MFQLEHPSIHIHAEVIECSCWNIEAGFCTTILNMHNI
jgi:hypothetical protein